MSDDEQTENTLYDLIIKNLIKYSEDNISLLDEDNSERENFKNKIASIYSILKSLESFIEGHLLEDLFNIKNKINLNNQDLVDSISLVENV